MEISDYFQQEEGVSFHHYWSQKLIDVLHIVFKHNFLKFGDTYWRQKSGTGMGISPAPPWTTIFFGLYEEKLLSKWKEHVGFYKRFIDDVLGTWRSHPCPTRERELWDEFCHDMNQWDGLGWDCEAPATTIDFMDLTISIIGNPESLFVSACPLLTPSGSRDWSSARSSASFLSSMLQSWRCWQKGQSFSVLFDGAEENAVTYMNQTPAEHEARRSAKKEENHRQVRFHLEFHPQDPSSWEIQQLWRSEIAHPYNETPLHELENCEHVSLGFNRRVVVYSRPLNLRNLFSVRDISETRSAVSTYLAE